MTLKLNDKTKSNLMLGVAGVALLGTLAYGAHQNNERQAEKDQIEREQKMEATRDRVRKEAEAKAEAERKEIKEYEETEEQGADDIILKGLEMNTFEGIGDDIEALPTVLILDDNTVTVIEPGGEQKEVAVGNPYKFNSETITVEQIDEDSIKVVVDYNVNGGPTAFNRHEITAHGVDADDDYKSVKIAVAYAAATYDGGRDLYPLPRVNYLAKSNVEDVTNTVPNLRLEDKTFHTSVEWLDQQFSIER